MDKLSKTFRDSRNLEKFALDIVKKKSYYKDLNQKTFKYYVDPFESKKDFHNNLSFETLKASFLSESYSESPTVNEYTVNSLITDINENDDESNSSNLHCYRTKSCEIPSNKKICFKLDQKYIEEESETPFSDDNFIEEKFIINDHICDLSTNCEEESFLKNPFKENSSISSEKIEILIDFFLKKNQFYKDLKYALKEKCKFQIYKITKEWLSVLPQYFDLIVNNEVIILNKYRIFLKE